MKRIQGLAFFFVFPAVHVAVALACMGQVEASPAQAGSMQVHGPGVRPQLFFACCDQGMNDMESWVSNPEVISLLQPLHAGLAVEISDFSVERAQAMRKLNEARIPLTAWLVMSREQGDYLNGFNAPEAEKRFTLFEQWTQENGLNWGAVGLDTSQTSIGSRKRHQGSFLWLMIRRFFDYGQVEQGREAYS
ncbi:MAG: hypothetical protein WBX22_09745, partial [Silvibacterium sp.]